MKRNKLLKELVGFLDMKGRKQREHLEELSMLLVKLKKKRIDLEKELLLEKDKRKVKRLGKELEIVNAQYAKGEKVLQELDTL